ncbi:hypothetical protein C0J52_16975 [Blattella germanica]|nr:hypothetical protein C0J52_16975 [Blattella germanica]
MSNKKWAIGGEARRFIYSVIQFCEMEKSQGIQIPITNPTARVTITKDDWIGAIRHVNQISDDYWTRDGLLEEELDRIIINVGIDSTDESSDDEIQRESATDSSATETADTSATESGDEVTTFMNMGVERL